MPLRPCRQPGCPALTEGRFCKTHEDKAQPFAEHVGSSTARGYDHAWRKAARAFLAVPENALCAECARCGRVTAAGCVDHIRPWRSGATPDEQEHLRLDRSNWQPLCDYRSPFNCHGRKTAREAASLVACDARPKLDGACRPAPMRDPRDSRVVSRGHIIAPERGTTGAPDGFKETGSVKIAPQGRG